MRQGTTHKHPYEWIKDWGWKEVSRGSAKDVLLEKENEYARLLGSQFIVWDKDADKTPGPDQIGDTHYGYINSNLEGTVESSDSGATGADKPATSDVPRKRSSTSKRAGKTASAKPTGTTATGDSSTTAASID